MFAYNAPFKPTITFLLVSYNSYNTKVAAKSLKPKWRTNKQTQEIERVYF